MKYHTLILLGDRSIVRHPAYRHCRECHTYGTPCCWQRGLCANLYESRKPRRWSGPCQVSQVCVHCLFSLLSFSIAQLSLPLSLSRPISLFSHSLTLSFSLSYIFLSLTFSLYFLLLSHSLYSLLLSFSLSLFLSLSLSFISLILFLSLSLLSLSLYTIQAQVYKIDILCILVRKTTTHINSILLRLTCLCFQKSTIYVQLAHGSIKAWSRCMSYSLLQVSWLQTHV